MMYYQIMCHAARRGCTIFDFGRSKVGTGTYAFKENWGFEPQPLVYAVRTAAGELLTVAGVPCRNPAFDVTPADLVWALVTEHGVARPVTPEAVRAIADV